MLQKDPLKVRHHQLKNGLQLFLSVNKNEPRIFTNIVFRAGSKYDPADTTGLAHYMEHMLFKGTSKIGATDWAKESVYLEQIADLFEVYRKTSDTAQRKEIYQKIDRLSSEAAELVAPNEYDQLMTTLGAKDTNAYTWLEQTVYVNDIPSNELERWMILESERFRALALRLFHTELETVYEEFNISQDKDFRKVYKALRAGLYPNHPYGTQTTLGKPEHLKNPSMRAIQRYFETWYVPNNMAIVLAGDFDPDQVIRLAEQYFGQKDAKSLPPFSFDPQPVITQPIRSEVFGREAAYLQLAWRLDQGKSDDALMAVLVDHLLHNQQAGLIDVHLLQKQEVLAAESWVWLHEDFSAIGLYGKPREGQSLEEVEELLLSQVTRLANGDWPAWLLEACIRDLRQADVRAQVNNHARVAAIANCYILGIPWERYVNRFAWMAQLKKEDVVAWVKKNLDPQGYVVVYKKEGEDPDVIKVDKPDLNPIQLNKQATSAFAEQLLAKPDLPLKPVFADFDQIKRHPLREGVHLDYVRNPDNELFNLDVIFEMGKLNDRLLPLAMSYLPYLHTHRYSATEWQREFFRLGLHFETSAYDRRTYLSLSGLEESFAEGLQLMVHLLEHCQADQATWQAVALDIIQKRDNAKQNRQSILRDGLNNYARYGIESPWRHRLSAEELQALDPERLTECLKQLPQFQHRLHYFGQQAPEDVILQLEAHYPLQHDTRPPLAEQPFVQLPTTQNEVFFTHFPMVQADLMLVSRGTPTFNLEEYLIRELYNEYFGYGLSSIFFQEIREARALAYNTYSFYSSPKRRDMAHYLMAYVGTQPDKVEEALQAAHGLIDDMPVIPDMIEQTRLSILKRIESDRIPIHKLYWEAQNVRDLGYNHDLLIDIYQKLQNLTVEDLVKFHQTYVKDRSFKLLVLGDRDTISQDTLERFGPMRELGMEELFGY